VENGLLEFKVDVGPLLGGVFGKLDVGSRKEGEEGRKDDSLVFNLHN
jgi:hypothetical protein